MQQAPTSDDLGFKAALEEAKQGFSEGGVPIGACLVDKDGKILGRGHNMRVQKKSATLHVCRLPLIQCHESDKRLPMLPDAAFPC